MRPIRRHLTFANVTSVLALFLVLTGGTAVALSGSNTVFTDDIANDTQLAGGGNPAGGLAAVDLRPGSVGTSEVANNSLTGADVNESTLAGFIRGRKVDLNLTLGDPETKIATVGPYELSGECFDSGGAGAFLSIFAKGPAGRAETVYSQVRNDTTDGGNESQADTLLANGTEVVFFDGTPGGQGYTRFGGTLVLRSSSGAVVQVDFSALTSDTATVCHLWGTATIGT